MSFIPELTTKAVAAFKRFPFTCLWVLFGSIALILELEIDEDRFFNNSRNLMLSLSLGVSWLIAVQFFIEQFPQRKRSWILKFLILALIAIYHFSLPDYSSYSNANLSLRWFLLFLSGHVFLFFAPFVRSFNSAAFWNYLKNIILSIGRSILFSGIFYLGLVFALLAISSLFDIGFKGRVYWQLFIICLGIINTWIYLSDFPQKVQENTQVTYNKPLEVLVKFILIPLILIYLLILYLYAIKIVLSWTLPQGWISYMITVLALLGFVIQLIIDPVKENHPSLLLRKFHPWFYILLAPLMLLLFTAVFRRIVDYNFTESRYFLMLLSFWILGIIIYLLGWKKRQLRILPISLFLLILMGTYGPWGAFQVSARAQLTELKELLTTAKDQVITGEEEQRILNIIRYLDNRNKLSETKGFLGFDPELAFKDQPGYMIGRKILDTLNTETDPRSIIEDRWFSFHRGPENSLSLDLEGYSQFAELSMVSTGKTPLKLSADKGSFSIHRNKELLLQFDIEEELLNAVRTYGNLYQAPPEIFDFEYKNDKGVFKIIVKEISYSIEAAHPKFHSATIYLFYGEPLLQD